MTFLTFPHLINSCLHTVPSYFYLGKTLLCMKFYIILHCTVGRLFFSGAYRNSTSSIGKCQFQFLFYFSFVQILIGNKNFRPQCWCDKERVLWNPYIFTIWPKVFSTYGRAKVARHQNEFRLEDTYQSEKILSKNVLTFFKTCVTTLK